VAVVAAQEMRARRLADALRHLGRHRRWLVRPLIPSVPKNLRAICFLVP
jgi:hypothetical protein